MKRAGMKGASMREVLGRLVAGLRGMRRGLLLRPASLQLAPGDRMRLWGSYCCAVFEGGDAIPRAMAVVNAILRKQPFNPLVIACKGSLLGLTGEEADNPNDRRRWADLCATWMDEAFDRLNDFAASGGLRTQTLLVCAATNTQLPLFYDRQRLARRQIAPVITRSSLRLLNRCGQACALATAALLIEAEGDDEASRALFVQALDLDRKTAERVFHARPC